MGATNTDLSYQSITREEDGPCSPRLLFKTRNIPQCCDTPSLASVSTSCFTWKQWYKNNGKPLVSKKRQFRKMLSEPAGANDRRTNCAACLSANSWSDSFPPYISFCLFFPCSFTPRAPPPAAAIFIHEACRHTGTTMIQFAPPSQHSRAEHMLASVGVAGGGLCDCHETPLSLIKAVGGKIEDKICRTA